MPYLSVGLSLTNPEYRPTDTQVLEMLKSKTKNNSIVYKDSAFRYLNQEIKSQDCFFDSHERENLLLLIRIDLPYGYLWYNVIMIMIEFYDKYGGQFYITDDPVELSEVLSLTPIPDWAKLPYQQAKKVEGFFY